MSRHHSIAIGVTIPRYKSFISTPKRENLGVALIKKQIKTP